MLVQEWMSKNVLTVSADTSMMKASRIMKEKKVRRLPVVDEANRVIGIVSDRDVRDASPSKATTLDMHELYYLLSELKVKDIMAKNPVCARENDSMEAMALVMAEKRFGGMPVVDAANKLVGIITASDIFKVLATITGVRIGGIQLAFELSVAPGSLRPILGALREFDAGVISVLTSQESNEASSRRVYIRLRPMAPDAEQRVIAEMQKLFTSLLYWEPGMGVYTG